jgi:hypothetical protein
MINIRTLVATAGLSALCAPMAFADQAVLPSSDSTFTKWGEEAGWTIYVDETRNSCLIERVDEAENVVQMGVTENQDMIYVGVFTKADIGLSGGKEDIVLSLDGNLYEGQSQRLTKHLPEGYTGGYVLSQSPKFLEDVERKYEMVVMPEHENAVVVNLDGTFKAIEAAKKCQSEQGA